MSDENYGLTIPEGIAYQTMTSGDINDTCESKPHFDVVRQKLRDKVLDGSADLADRLAAQQTLRLSYNERLPIRD
jgi:hypothetical protein